ncbi:hypothetical protein L207DRAFT_520847 [Hyaloscypha variabilis F]|uniref:Uncharacterized protein n=1 Tax=Hyaloscypha variabilis (strain UAMH 11265 / GT02V1 / F) TaxID=1149755 RepID=A0A2J6QTG3_HYAVF|nr:hypothetical protein L207DRAFT_520847 [Hyaloscypha variabilis F]
MGRDSSCWEAVGAARETFIRIADEIKNHLEKASEPVPQAVTWTMYMIGKTKETAEPMILFCCRESASRKQVRTTIEESGILQRYPGVRVGDASRPPDFDQLVQLAGESSGSLNVGQNAKTKKLEFRCEANGSLYANRKHLGYDFESVMGNRIFVKLPGKDATIRKATIGGIVQSGLREFYLTAGHAFESSHSEASEDIEDDFDYDIGEESDTEAEQDFIDSTSRGSLSPERPDYSSSDEFSTSMGTESDISPNPTGKSISRVPPRESNYNTDTADSGYASALPRRFFENREVYVGNILVPRLSQNHPILDYALIEITKPSFIEYGHSILRSGSISLNLALSTTIESVPHNTKILAITSSGRNLEGTISGTPTYNTAESNKVHELWTIKLDGRLEEGDCGSWVVSARGGVFYGHIVAGSPESGAAYVVPAYQIFHDAKCRFGVDLKLPTKKPLEVEAGTQVQATKQVTSASSSTSASLHNISPVPSASYWNPKGLKDNSKQGTDRSDNRRLGLRGHEKGRPSVYAEHSLRKEVEIERTIVAPKLSSFTPPSSPPRSPARGAKIFPVEGKQNRRRSQQPFHSLKPSRQHRKERIVIIDEPPSPRAPPQMFTPPSPTDTTLEFNPVQITGRVVETIRARPVIVDERPLHRYRSIDDMSERPRRPRSSSRTRTQWDSPSSSHTSFDERARREVEETEARERDRERRRAEHIARVEAERRRNERIRQQNEEIRRRPAVPLPSAPLIRTRSGDQTQDLKGKMIGLSVSDESSRGREVEEWSPREEREREQARRDRLRDEEEEAMRQRMRERQMPKRRSSVGPGNRRQRVLYNDGVYRWE